MLRAEEALQHTPSRPDKQPGMQTHGASSHARRGLRPKLPGLLAKSRTAIGGGKGTFEKRKKSCCGGYAVIEEGPARE